VCVCVWGGGVHLFGTISEPTWGTGDSSPTSLHGILVLMERNRGPLTLRLLSLNAGFTKLHVSCCCYGFSIVFNSHLVGVKL
jgi:hypothetical protein